MPRTNAERQKAYRERNGRNVTPVTERNAPLATRDHAECRRKIEVLEGEVAALRRELAERGKGGGANHLEQRERSGRTQSRPDSTSAPVVRSAVGAERKKAGAGGYHGVLCPCPPCKAERAPF